MELLSHVAGLTGPVAEKMAAAFLRNPGAANPLDASAVHPEREGVVERIAKRLGLPLEALLGVELDVDPKDCVDEQAGLPTLIDILAQLRKPGRDPGKEFAAARFDPKLTKLEDLCAGMELEGVVTHVAGFGAFIDLGIQQDGLLHVSQIRAPSTRETWCA